MKLLFPNYKNPLSSLKETPARQKYTFIPDSLETISEKGDVYFLIGLKNIHDGINVDPNDVKQRIHNLTEDIAFVRYFFCATTILCVSNQETYEKVWHAKLHKDVSQKGMKGYTPNGYTEHEHKHPEARKGTVPTELEDIIKSVGLNYNI